MDKRHYVAAKKHVSHLFDIAEELLVCIEEAELEKDTTKKVNACKKLASNITELSRQISTSVYAVNDY